MKLHQYKINGHGINNFQHKHAFSRVFKGVFRIRAIFKGFRVPLYKFFQLKGFQGFSGTLVTVKKRPNTSLYLNLM